MKIYHDTSARKTPEWCWHRGWATGHDSAYGLLMKFAFLNALTARDIARLFTSRKRGTRTGLLRSLRFDLRDSKHFDLDAMASAFCTDAKALRDAFLDLRFFSSSDSEGNLKWCEQCLAWGLHVAALQMRAVQRCPLHNVALRDTCFWCERTIPYEFSAALFDKPFCCPHCGADMAPQLKLARSKLRAPSPRDIILIERMNRFVMTFARSVERKGPILRAIPGLDSLSLPGTDPAHEDAYLEFVGQVVDVLKISDDPQNVPLAGLIVFRCGCGSVSTPGTLCEHFSCNGEDNDAFGIDQELAVAVDVYRALRRRFWSELKTHRQCVRSACHQLWRDMRGQKTVVFCPKAATYMRWRMLWEGCGAPRFLQTRRQADYYGISGWLHARPAPYPDDWTRERKTWMLSHIFANACLASHDAIERTIGENSDTMCWESSVESTFVTTHWALSNPASARSTVLFVPARHRKAIAVSTDLPRRAHSEWHVGQVQQIDS